MIQWVLNWWHILPLGLLLHSHCRDYRLYFSCGKLQLLGKKLLLQIWMHINFSLSAEQQVFLVAFLDFHVIMSVNSLVKL